jgi:uncharacterized coiled-coil protein SlyX
MLTIVAAVAGFLLGVAFLAINWRYVAKVRKALDEVSERIKAVEAGGAPQQFAGLGMLGAVSAQTAAPFPPVESELLKAVRELTEQVIKSRVEAGKLSPAQEQAVRVLGSHIDEQGKDISAVSQSVTSHSKAIEAQADGLGHVRAELERLDRMIRGVEADMHDEIARTRKSVERDLDSALSDLEKDAEEDEKALSKRLGIIEASLKNIANQVVNGQNQLGRAIDDLSARTARPAPAPVM